MPSHDRNRQETSADTEWFVRDRFGLFIHWGVYALSAQHEWVMNTRRMTNREYEGRYFDHFDPDLYDPAVWARAAAGAGMKYFVITTKHHDGFCLWDSALTEYKAPNAPCGRDLLRPMVEAFRAEGLRVGFYHSLLDWHHDQYIIDEVNHPLRNAPNRHELNRGRDQMRYADYLHGQVRELLTGYGQVDILWFDFSFPDTEARLDFTRGKGREAWRSEELYRLVRELQPQAIVNNGLDLETGCDFRRFEHYHPRSRFTIDGKAVVWEACQTLSPSGWGYSRADEGWRSVRDLLTTLIDCVSKGGNLLLNVGPTGRGEIDQRALDRLAGMGKWMHYHGRSIYGCTEAPADFSAPPNCLLTYSPDRERLYVHVLTWPHRHLHLDGRSYVERLDHAQLLHDASELTVLDPPPKQAQAARDAGLDPEQTLTLQVPPSRPPVEIPVVELYLRQGSGM